MKAARFLSGVAVTTAALISTTVSAQADQPATAQTTGAPDRPDADKTAQTATEEQGLPEVVVTATRRDERLQQVPISVTAVTGAELERSGIVQTRELTQTVPSLNFRTVNVTAQPIIRGVGSRGTSPGDESNVAIYLDGVYVVSPTAGLFDLMNVQRVEVLRGPQGTLFGRNATGGLINVITTNPSRELTAKARVSYGRFNEFTAAGYVSGGIAPNLTADVAAQYYHDTGFVRDLRTGKHVYPRLTYSVRGRLRFEPSSTGSMTVSASWSHLDDASNLYMGVYQGNTAARSLANNPHTLLATGPWQTATDVKQLIKTDVLSLADEIHLDLGPVIVENTASYERAYNDAILDNDGTPVDLGVIINLGRSDITGTGRQYGTKSLQNELRLLSSGDTPFSYIAGLYYIHSIYQNGPVVIGGAGTSALPYSTLLTKATLVDSTGTTDSIAPFGEVTWKFAHGFKAVGGVRYTSETRTLNGRTTRGGVVLTSISGAKSKFDKFTYRGILQYDFGRVGNVYASYSRGFKSGVYNLYSTPANSKATRPEVLDAMELGVKLDPLPWLRINGAIYHYDYKDIQLSSRDPATNLAVLFNATNAKIKGGEIEVTLRPVHNLNIRGYATYTDAHYTNFPGAQIFKPIYQNQTSIGGSAATPIGNATVIADVSGAEVIRSPKFTTGGSFDYTVPMSSGSLGFSGNVFHTAKYYWDVNNRTFQPAYTVVNGEVSWTLPNDKVRFSVWGRNLTNAVIQNQINPSATFDAVSYERPRTFGVAVEVKY